MPTSTTPNIITAVKEWIALPPNSSSASSARVTVTLALLALVLFGGRAIHSFSVTMMFGVVLVGTYTSIFIASPLLIYLGVTTRSMAEAAKDDEKAEKAGRPAAR